MKSALNENKLLQITFLIIAISSSYCAESFGQDAQAKPAEPARVIKVPSDRPTLASAVSQARDGDWIILSPGTYSAKNIDLTRPITISSEWKLTGDINKIEETIIDADDETLFNITADGVEISGLHIINGDHTLNILSRVTILHNHFERNKDAMSFEGSGGGYAGYNLVENDRDDGIDADIGSDPKNPGHDLHVTYNTIINSHDDGMEIRLFEYPDQNIHYEISHNTIVGSKNAGIQLISYDRFTGKEFRIHHNIFRECKVGLGCMEGSNTVENLGGASKMDELVCFFNNTLVGNQMGATGGNHVLAVNNIVQGNKLGGFKRFGKNSAAVNNVFYQNGGDDILEFSPDVIKSENIFSTDPLLDMKTFAPAAGSVCVDAGKEKYPDGTANLVDVAAVDIAGKAPDIGAVEFGSIGKPALASSPLVVDAGDDIVLTSPDSEFELAGTVSGAGEGQHAVRWSQVSGPKNVAIMNPDKLKTKVTLKENGIYQFSLTGTVGRQSGRDDKIVRFVKEGSGHRVFLKNGVVNEIEAEEFAFAYGNAGIDGDNDSEGAGRSAVLQRQRADQAAFLEYSLGASNTTEFTGWLLVRNSGKNGSKVKVTFNGVESPEFQVKPGNQWKWVRIPMAIHVTGGEWPFLIAAEQGSIGVDKIVLSPDKSYVPK